VEKETLFKVEEQTIEDAEKIVNDKRHRANSLIDDFEKLLNGYKKIYKQTRRIIRMNDMMQQKLNKAIKEVEAASQAKGEFLANMSHEIRTPLNAIIGMTDLALDMELSPKLDNYLNTVRISAHSLLGLINDILDFSKIEAGKLDLEYIDFNLQDVMNNLSSMFLNKVAGKGIRLNTSVTEDVPYLLVGDALRLGQVLINLVNNAVKFTHEGCIEINVAMHEGASNLSRDMAMLLFSVKDTGIGISEQLLQKLFKIHRLFYPGG